MNLPPQPSILQRLRERGLLFPVAVGVVGAAVLLHGAWRNRHPVLEVPANTPALSESRSPVLVNLRPDLEKIPLSYADDYWLQLADGASSKLVLVPGGIPGVIVSPGLALTSLKAAEEFWQQVAHDPETEAGASNQEAVPGRLLGWDAAAQVAVFAVSESLPSFSLATPASLHPGASVAAVSLTPEERVRVIPGHLVSLPSSLALLEGLDVALPFPDSTRAAAVVDLDGGLVGVATESATGIKVVSAEAAVALARRLREPQSCQALETGVLAPHARKVLRLRQGLLVQRVRTEAFRTTPALRAGDVLLEWNGQKLDDPEEFVKLYAATPPGTAARFLAVREGRRVRGKLIVPGPGCLPPPSPVWAFPEFGLSLRWVEEDEQLQVASVLGNGPAARAGLETHDLLLALDGRSVQGPEARRRLELTAQRSGEVLLTTRRGDLVLLYSLSAQEGKGS